MVIPFCSDLSGGAKIRIAQYVILLFLPVVLSCSSPAKVEVRPNPLILEGTGAKGTLEAVIFDENGKDITDKYSVTYLCLDEKTVKVQQDGTVEARSSGKTLVDVEVVGAEVHGVGNVEVKIPSFIEPSMEEVVLLQGGPKAWVWAEVRDDNSFQMKGILPSWKVEKPEVVSVTAAPQDDTQTRSYVSLTPLEPGDTYVTAFYKELAVDIHVVVSPAPAADGK